MMISTRPGHSPHRGERAATRGRRGQAGFTLLELIIVLVILAGVATLVAPRMVGWYETFAFRDGVRRLQAALNLARLTAIREGKVVPARAAEDGKAVAVAGYTIRFGGQGRVDRLGPADRGGLAPDDDDAVIAFYPDGSADWGMIAVARDEQETATLEVNPVTGRAKIAWQ